MNEILVIWLSMTLVTYIPRLWPFLMIKEKPLPPKLHSFLLFVPYAALGALILPGTVSALPGKPAVSLAGAGAAVLLAWFKGGIILPVIGAVMAVLIMLLSG